MTVREREGGEKEREGGERERERKEKINYLNQL